MQATVLFMMGARKSKELDELTRRGTFRVLGSITTQIEVQRTWMGKVLSGSQKPVSILLVRSVCYFKAVHFPDKFRATDCACIQLILDSFLLLFYSRFLKIKKRISGLQLSKVGCCNVKDLWAFGSTYYQYEWRSLFFDSMLGHCTSEWIFIRIGDLFNQRQNVENY